MMTWSWDTVTPEPGDLGSAHAVATRVWPVAQAVLGKLPLARAKGNHRVPCVGAGAFASDPASGLARSGRSTVARAKLSCGPSGSGRCVRCRRCSAPHFLAAKMQHGCEEFAGDCISARATESRRCWQSVTVRGRRSNGAGVLRVGRDWSPASFPARQGRIIRSHQTHLSDNRLCDCCGIVFPWLVTLRLCGVATGGWRGW